MGVFVLPSAASSDITDRLVLQVRNLALLVERDAFAEQPLLVGIHTGFPVGGLGLWRWPRFWWSDCQCDPPRSSVQFELERTGMRRVLHVGDSSTHSSRATRVCKVVSLLAQYLGCEGKRSSLSSKRD